MWERKGKKRWRHGWMLSLLICLTHSLLKWEWMEGFPMSWLEDGWVCSFGCNWLKTGIQLGIIESWKSLKAQVHEIIRRANQVVINLRCKWCAGYGRRGACYPAVFKVARLSSHKGAFKHFEADFRVRVCVCACGVVTLVLFINKGSALF